MNDEKEIYMGDGDYVEGDKIVKAGDHGVAIGGDLILNYFTSPFVPKKPDLVKLKAVYLRYLQEHYQHIDFKGTSLLEAVEKASGVALKDIFVPLQATADRPDGETIFPFDGLACLVEESQLRLPATNLFPLPIQIRAACS